MTTATTATTATGEKSSGFERIAALMEGEDRDTWLLMAARSRAASQQDDEMFLILETVARIGHAQLKAAERVERSNRELAGEASRLIGELKTAVGGAAGSRLDEESLDRLRAIVSEGTKVPDFTELRSMLQRTEGTVRGLTLMADSVAAAGKRVGASGGGGEGGGWAGPVAAVILAVALGTAGWWAGGEAGRRNAERMAEKLPGLRETALALMEADAGVTLVRSAEGTSLVIGGGATDAWMNGTTAVVVLKKKPATK